MLVCLSVPTGTHNHVAFDCKLVLTACRQTAYCHTKESVPLTAVTDKCRPNETISFTHVTQLSAVSLELQYIEFSTFYYRCGHIFLLVHTTIHLEETDFFFPMTYQRMQLRYVVK